jgi:(2Fe-2S) ferredoxin
MAKYKEKTTQFSLVGELKGFILKDGYKLKYLRLGVASREYWVKVRKDLRHTLEEANSEGVYLKIRGESQICGNGTLKLKADFIEIIAPTEAYFTFDTSSQTNVVSFPTQSNKPKKASILICQKSSCWKRGGEAVYETLTQNLDKHGLAEVVSIKTTGCLKKCKKAPNLVFMPDSAHYSYVGPQQIEGLLHKHFGESPKS